MVKSRKTWQDNIRSSIWCLNKSANELKGIDGYEDLASDILTLSARMRLKFNTE